MIKNTIIKNILLSICSITAVGTVGTTVYNTIETTKLRNENQEIVFTIEEKDNKINELQQQLDEIKIATEETTEQSTDEIENENEITSNNTNATNTKTVAKANASSNTYENTRETTKQELIQQRDELQRQIDSKNAEIKEIKQGLDNEYYSLIEQKKNLENVLNDTKENTEQYNTYKNQLQEINSKITQNKKDYESKVGVSSDLKKALYDLIAQRDTIQQQINEL